MSLYISRYISPNSTVQELHGSDGEQVPAASEIPRALYGRLVSDCFLKIYIFQIISYSFIFLPRFSSLLWSSDITGF